MIILSSGARAFLEVISVRAKSENKNLHPRVKVDQAVRPLLPKTLSILVGLVLKLISMCNHNL